MSLGGPSNLGTLLIRRLDTALSVAASQQSQIVNAARTDAVLQLADATRVDPLHNEGGRPLPETIDKALSQAGREGRPVADARLQARPLPSATQRPSTETSTTPSAPTTLGHAAKTILALLARFPGQAPPVTGRAPLLGTAAAALNTATAAGTVSAPPQANVSSTPTPPLASTQATVPVSPGDLQSTEIARSLGLVVRHSGLFYESHLQALLLGARTVAQLKLEPQGQVRMSTSAPPPGASPQASAAAQTLSPPTQQGVPPAASPAPDSTLTEARSMPAASGHAGQSQAPALPGLHPDMHLVVRQQLETLAAQTFSWQGEAWPDAQMDWEICRQDEHGASDEAGTHWATRLRLSLPVLGDIEARLSLHGKQVVMRLVAPQCAHTLRQHDHVLRTAFLEADLTLGQLSIDDKEAS